jgi:hypothetical protein
MRFAAAPGPDPDWPAAHLKSFGWRQPDILLWPAPESVPTNSAVAQPSITPVVEDEEGHHSGGSHQRYPPPVHSNPDYSRPIKEKAFVRV